MNPLPSIAEVTGNTKNSTNQRNGFLFPHQPVYTNYPSHPFYFSPPQQNVLVAAHPNSTGSYLHGQSCNQGEKLPTPQLIGKKRSIKVLHVDTEESEEIVSSTPTWILQGQTQHFSSLPPQMYHPSPLRMQPIATNSMQYHYPQNAYPYYAPSPQQQHSNNLQSKSSSIKSTPSSSPPITTATESHQELPRSKTNSINTNPSKKLRVDENLIKQSLMGSEKGNESTPLAKYYSNFIQQGATSNCKEEHPTESTPSSVEQAQNLLSLEQISKYFENTEHEASQHLNVSTTKLKLICRGLQIYKWPYRKLKSLQKRIDSLEALLPKLSNEQNIHVTVTHAMVRARLLSSSSDDTGSVSLINKCIEYLRDLKRYICKVPKLLAEYSSEELLIAHYCDVILPQQVNQKPIKLEIKSEVSSPTCIIKQEVSSPPPPPVKPESKPLKSFRLAEINKEEEEV